MIQQHYLGEKFNNVIKQILSIIYTNNSKHKN